MYKINLQKNGFKTCTYNMPQMKSVACGIWIRAGGRYENKTNCGVSHFLEHLLFKGTPKRSARELKEAVEGVGGQLNGFTSEELTCYFVKIIDSKLNLAVDVLSDMVLNAKLAEEDIERERMVIIEEIKMYLDQPAQHVHDLFNEILFYNHPLGMPLAGTIESVKGIGRKELIRYKNKFYHPSNIVFSGSGLIDSKKFESSILSLRLKKDIPSDIDYAKAKEHKGGPDLKFLFKKTEQTHLCLGTYAPARDDLKRFTMSLLNIILGGNMSSRLFQEIRERLGYTYDIGSYFRKYSDIGSFAISAGIENKKLEPAVRAIVKELKKIKRQPPKADELKRAKEFYIGQLHLALENTLDHMMWLGENISLGAKFYIAGEIIKLINKVKPIDISNLANEIFRDRSMKIALIGPHRRKDLEYLDDLLTLKV